MYIFILLIISIQAQKKDCEMCDLIEYQNSYDNDPMFYNRTKFNWTTDELREKINKTLINQLKIDVETIKYNKDLAKTIPLDELKKAVTVWNSMKVQEQADKIRQIKVPSYIPVPVYTVYQIPILHHFPVEQLIRKFKGMPYGVPMENEFTKYHYTDVQDISEKVAKPATIPFDVKVPIPVTLPMDTDESKKKTPPHLISYLRNQYHETESKIQDQSEVKRPNLIGQLKQDFLDKLKE